MFNPKSHDFGYTKMPHSALRGVDVEKQVAVFQKAILNLFPLSRCFNGSVSGHCQPAVPRPASYHVGDLPVLPLYVAFR